MQLPQADHPYTGLLYPVTPRDAEVKETFRHVTGDLLGPEDLHLRHARIIDAAPIIDIGAAADGEIGLGEELQGGPLQ